MLKKEWEKFYKLKIIIVIIVTIVTVVIIKIHVILYYNNLMSIEIL